MKNILIIHQPVLDSVVEILDYAEVYELSTIINLKSDYYQKIITNKYIRGYCVYKIYCKTNKRFENYYTVTKRPPKHCPENQSHEIDEKLTMLVGYVNRG